MGYWQALRGSGEHVPVEKFDPAAISDLWSHCFALVPATEAREASFRHIGDKIAMESGVDTKDVKVADIPDNTPLGVTLELASEVIKINFPVVDSGEFQDAQGERRLYRSILVPFSNDQGVISLLVGAARCTRA
jgi:hypothetical protein